MILFDILMLLMFITIMLAGLLIIALGLGGVVIRGRLSRSGAWYLLYGAVTKFGFTKDLIGNTLQIRLGKSKLKFIVNPAHKTYLWGKPLYILSVEYATSVKPSMLATLSALKELGKDDLVKEYLDLTYQYNEMINALQSVQSENEKKKLEVALNEVSERLAKLEEEMNEIVDKNAKVYLVKPDGNVDPDENALVVRQIDPELLNELRTGVDAPRISANMDLYALHMSSIFRSDLVKFAFAAMLVLIGVGVLYFLVSGQNPQVNIQISPELLKSLANETVKNVTKVVRI